MSVEVSEEFLENVLFLSSVYLNESFLYKATANKLIQSTNDYLSKEVTIPVSVELLTRIKKQLHTYDALEVCNDVRGLDSVIKEVDKIV